MPINPVEKAPKLTDEAKKELQSVGMMDEKGKLKIKGVSPKMLKRMKQEQVDCPVLNKRSGSCSATSAGNFSSRVMGKVYCKGEPVSDCRQKFINPHPLSASCLTTSIREVRRHIPPKRAEDFQNGTLKLC